MISVTYEPPFNVLAPPTAAGLTALGSGLMSPNNGATIQMPAGDFDLSGSTINLAGTFNVTLKGQGSTYGGTRLKTSSASGPVINAQGSSGLKLEDIAFFASNAAYASPLVDLGTSGVGVAGGALFRLRDCNFTCAANGAITNNVVDLNNALGGFIEGCYFIGGGVAIQGAHTNSFFSNANTIVANYFQQQTTSSIQNLFSGNLITGNTFEPLFNTTPGAYFQTATIPCHGLGITGNYFGDITGAGVVLSLVGDGINVAGNLFSQSSGLSSFGVQVNGVNGLSVSGNTFLNLARAMNLSSPSTKVFYLGNNDSSCTTPVVGRALNAGAGSLIDDSGTLFSKGAITTF